MATKSKQKTHKGASKRFKITGSGKVLRRSHYLRHKRSKKSKSNIRRLKFMKEITGRFRMKMKKLLALK